MSELDALRLHGGLGSPYTLKMRAYLRYRRIPHVFIQMSDMNEAIVRQVRPSVIPVLEWPDGRVANDSTYLIRDLERDLPGRRATPDDPPTNFLSLLLEDFADEWGTKWMFDFRWALPRDQEMCSRWIAFDRYGALGRAELESRAAAFRDRQVGRMPLVGCTPANRPALTNSFRTVLAALEAQVSEHRPFLFGTRPSAADFAFYGQLSQLASDPTSADLMRREAPYATRWVLHMEDLSGTEGEWALEVSPPVRRLLALAGELYLPFLAANSAALRDGAESFSLEVLGHSYRQAPFRYQEKCLQDLRCAFADLDAAARTQVEGLLGSGASVLQGASA